MIWPHQTAVTHGIDVPPEALDRVRRLYDQGLMLQAWEAACQVGPLDAWRGAEAGTWAGRLAVNLGGARLSRILHWRTWKRHRTSLRANVYHAVGFMERRGPIEGLAFLESIPESTGDPDSLLYLYTLRARALGLFRDFDAAQVWIEKGRSLQPDSAWLATEEAFLLERRDRYQEGLDVLMRGLNKRPWYRPGVQTLAHFLRLLDRDQEALALLSEASQRLECSSVQLQLATLQMDMEMFEEADANLDRYLELSPLASATERQWVDRQRITTACRRGRLPQALALAQGIDEPYYKGLSERLSAPTPGVRRVHLKVPFVRQHHMTCAPATLSALSRFWNLPAEHLEVAEAICYDGTPAQSERRWAEKSGWRVREFTVTYDTAVALLNRGLPFTLTTAEATNAHLQAVVGYDELRATLLLRDPFVYGVVEALADALLSRHQATGPRGMVMVPESRGDLLDGLELPDADLYDIYYEAQKALDAHDRDCATAALDRLADAAPGHRLTFTAQRALAGYDDNSAAVLESLKRLLELYPKDGNLNLARLACLRDLGSRQERLDILETLCEQRDIDPVFYQQFAIELMQDARERSRANDLLDRALRRDPLNAGFLGTSAEMLWEMREFPEAIRRYRFAACLGDKSEPSARNYLLASRIAKQTDQALQFLQARVERLGRQNAGPAMTLFDSLCHLSRPHEAFDVLKAALAGRPDDGELTLFAADAHARYGRLEEADRFLQQARDKTRQASWLRLAARLASYRSDRTGALQLWRDVLAAEPLALDANRETAVLIAETEGRIAALDFLNEVIARFPHHCSLHALRVEWLRDEPAERRLGPLRDLIAINPADAWAQRELALVLASHGRHEEALEAATHAIGLQPNRPYGYNVRGKLHLDAGRGAEARQDLREAIRLDVDNGFAITLLMNSCATLDERKEVLRFVEEQLVRQTVFGEGLYAYRSVAKGVLDPKEALTLCRRAHQARPDLWAAWSVVILELADAGEHEKALQLAREANERFPLVPMLWMARARVHQGRLEPDEEIEALQKALAINPAMSDAARQLASVHERRGDLQQSCAVLEAACARAPLEEANHRHLGQMLWKLGRREEALQRMEHTARLNPGDSQAWGLARQWAAELDQPARTEALLRDLIIQRAGEARTWLLSAEIHFDEELYPDAISDLDRALERNPRCEEAYDLKALAFVRLNRVDDALAACQPPGFDPVPAPLQARAAWIDAQRGNLKRAIATLEKVLAESPNMPGYWEVLGGWYHETNDVDRAVQAMERMAQLDPLNPVPLGYIGDIKRRHEDPVGAIDAFRRAFKIDPNYAFAGCSLFDLLMERKESFEANEVLQLLELHCPGPLAITRRGLYAAANGLREEAFQALTSLCTQKTDGSWGIDMLIQALDTPAESKRVHRLLKSFLRRKDANPWLGPVWVNRQVVRGKWWLAGWLKRWRKRGEMGRLALIAYVEALGNQYHQWRSARNASGCFMLRFHLWRVLRRHRSWIEKDDLAWGKVGYALTTIGRPRRVAHWLRDWQRRQGAQSWMLFNLTLALQALRRDREAFEVIQAGNHMIHHDPSVRSGFIVWAMLEESLRGNLDAARRHEGDLDPATLDEFFKVLHGLARMILEAENTPMAERSRLAAETRRRLRGAEVLSHQFGGLQTRILLRSARRATSRLAGLLGSMTFRLWAWWRGLDSQALGLLILALLLGGLSRDADGDDPHV